MQFDNTIDILLEAALEYKKKTNKLPFFISDWNPDKTNLITLNHNFFISKYSNHDYLYSIDDVGYKKSFINYCAKNNNQMLANAFTLFSNATLALYHVFNYLKMNNRNNILAFTPCYFTNESSIHNLQLNLSFFECIDFKYFNEIEFIKHIKLKKINAILISDPIYGVGKSIDISTYKSIIKICKEHKLSIVIDYAYGNMLWQEANHIFNFELFKILSNGDIDFYLVDSLPKKLFYNGLKFAMLFSLPQNIKKLEQTSIYIQGTITANQLNFYNNCYKINNVALLNTTINSYINKAQNTYKLLKNIIQQNSNSCILDSDSSIFSLVGISRKNIKKDDMNFAKSMIKDNGIFLTPHSRYNFYDDDFFYFRINLLKDTHEILSNLIKLLMK